MRSGALGKLGRPTGTNIAWHDKAFLEAQPLWTLFLAIGAGYALGQVSIFGFSLGAGAVLFTGLLFGAIAPKATPPAWSARLAC